MLLAWRKGFTRLYLVLWSLWVLFILVVGPAYVSIQASERARTAEVEYRAHVTAGNAVAAVDALRRMRENQRTTLASIYQDMTHTWRDLLIPLVGFPLALYGALYGSALLSACLIRSIRPARRGGPGTRSHPAASSVTTGRTLPKPVTSAKR